jgi:hypothetical protein
MGLFSLLCLWTACSSPKLAQSSVSTHKTTAVAYQDQAPQAAQSRPQTQDLQQHTQEVELVASNDPTMLPAVTKQLEASLTELSAENPRLARKMSRMARKVETQVSATADNTSGVASAKEKSALQKLMAKAEKKFDITKAKKADAAQANATLVGLGALLAVVGLVLLLATNGTGATVGLILLVIGVVLLVISLLSR